MKHCKLQIRKCSDKKAARRGCTHRVKQLPHVKIKKKLVEEIEYNYEGNLIII